MEEILTAEFVSQIFDLLSSLSF